MMEKEFFEGFESFMKNLSDFIPTDDTVLNLLQVEGEVHKLNDKLEKLYAKLGKEAEQLHGLEYLGETGEQLKQTKAELHSAKENLTILKEKLGKKYTRKNSDTNAEQMAPQTEEPESAENLFCTSCGKKIVPGDKFCGKCGTKLN